MSTEIEKMVRAREILNTIIQGEDPFNHEEIQKESFLHHPRMIRCLCYVNEVLTKDIEKEKRNLDRIPFSITDEDMKKVVFPSEDMGLTEFVNAINTVIDTEHMKGLVVTKFTKVMKYHHILGEHVEENGSKRTVCNEVSNQYGFYAMKGSYNGREYERVMINDKGKLYLKENLVSLLETYRET